MKKLTLVLFSIIILTMMPMHLSKAKPAYCKAAFVQCREDCGGGAFGYYCTVGCGIGYLFC